MKNLGYMVGIAKRQQHRVILYVQHTVWIGLKHISLHVPIPVGYSSRWSEIPSFDGGSGFVQWIGLSVFFVRGISEVVNSSVIYLERK